MTEKPAQLLALVSGGVLTYEFTCHCILPDKITQIRRFGALTLQGRNVRLPPKLDAIGQWKGRGLRAVVARAIVDQLRTDASTGEKIRVEA